MKPIVSHQSALEYWRMTRCEPRNYKALSHTKRVSTKAPVASELKREAFALFGALSLPLHILVSAYDARRSQNKIVCHLVNIDLPKGAILDTGLGFYVCSPEFCFVLMASCLDLPKLIELGFELCGTYDISRGSYKECEPLTTAAKLRAFVDKCANLHGIKKARQAISYVANNSASPMETISVILLCLPYRMGGYGIELPQLNYPITLDRKAMHIAGKRTCRCDLYWQKKKLAVEYEGVEYHEGEYNMIKDSSRRSALTSMGIKVVSVTKRDINYEDSLNGIAHLIAKHLGKKLKYQDPEFTQKYRELQKSLVRNRRS